MLASVTYIAESIKTGLDYLDLVQLRVAIAGQCLVVFGAKAVTDLRIPRACMAICHNEVDSSKELTEQVGDVDLPGGPSIGPMQVYFKSAKDYGLVPSDMSADDYQAKASNLVECIGFGVKVFEHKLSEAGGDVDEAVRRYNGGGDAAQAYKARALAFADKTWGGLS